jgi:hypothetical protein
MEEHAVATELQHSRAVLRALLLPDPETGRVEADVFPRSAVMQFLFNKRKRKMATAGLTAVAMLAGRRLGGGRISQVLRSFAGVFLAGRS